MLNEGDIVVRNRLKKLSLSKFIISLERQLEI